jgi:hypothetical protein
VRIFFAQCRSCDESETAHSMYVRHPCGQPCHSFVPKWLKNETADQTVVGAVVFVTREIRKPRLWDVLIGDHRGHVFGLCEPEVEIMSQNMEDFCVFRSGVLTPGVDHKRKRPSGPRRSDETLERCEAAFFRKSTIKMPFVLFKCQE